MIRRFGEPPRADQTYRRRPGVYAVILQGDSLLVTHQMDPIPEFQLPGGGIDRGGHAIGYDDQAGHDAPQTVTLPFGSIARA